MNVNKFFFYPIIIVISFSRGIIRGCNAVTITTDSRLAEINIPPI